MWAIFPERTIFASLGPWDIHWYGLLYVVAFIWAAWWLPRSQKYRQLTLSSDDWLLIVVVSMVGVLLGGRLGYVLLYAPEYFWQHPTEILALWQGGMASHGGFVGVGLALWWVSRHLKISFRALLDLIVVPTVVGLALGRIGNFINQELYGTITTLPWGVLIPGVEGQRHPVQLYEAVWDIVVALVCWWYLRHNQSAAVGRVAAVFLLLYAGGRLVISLWRVPDVLILQWGPWAAYESQLLTVPLLGLGAWLWHRWYAK